MVQPETHGEEVVPAKLEVLSGDRAGESISLTSGDAVIGSDEGATIKCADPEVEWSHARIYLVRDKYWIEDLESQGGVTVNQQRVTRQELSPGDEIGIGAARFRFGARTNGGGAGESEHPGKGAGDESVEDFVAQVVESVRAHTAAHAQAVAAEMAGQMAPSPAEVASEPAAIAYAPGAAAVAEPRAPVHGEEPPGPVFDVTPGAPLTPVPVAQSRPTEVMPALDPAALAEPAASAAAAIEPPTAAPPPEVPAAAVAAPPAGPSPEDRLRAALDLAKTESDAIKAENATLRSRLQLATESFVEQLERAKERIASFAKKHSETETLVRTREEELEKLKNAHHALELGSASRSKELLERLEAVRRDFDDIARLAAAKGQNLARLIGEAKTTVAREGPSGPVAGAAAAAAAASASALNATGSLSGVYALPPGGAEDLSSSGAGRRAPTAPGRPTARIAAATGAAATAGAMDAAAGAQASAPLAEAAAPAGFGGRLGAVLAPVKRVLGGEWATLAGVFVVIAGAAFLLIILFNARPDPRRANTTTQVPGPAKPAAPAGFEPVKPAPGATPKPASTTPPKATPPKNAQAPVTPGPAPPASPPVIATGDEGDETGLFGPLRKAHRTRDDKAIKEAETALIAKGKDILALVKEAYEKERQFNIKVSFQFVMLALEGKDSARDIVDAMRQTKEAGEKMRLAFMLSKLNKPEDVPFLEEAAQREEDPMIKKYIVRALGNVEGARGMQVLTQIAQSSQDRNLRIESIRAIEEKGSPESSTFLMDLARSEQDASIRSIAIRALSNVGGRESSSFFTQILETDDRTNNRAEAAKYWSRVGEPGDVQALESVFQRERVYYIRQKIRQAIDAINRRAGIEVSTPQAPEIPPPGATTEPPPPQ